MTDLIDGSLSTLAPVFATHQPAWSRKYHAALADAGGEYGTTERSRVFAAVSARKAGGSR
jgi:hypothetical protein